MNIDFLLKNSVLTVILEGRLDSSNAQDTEKAVEKNFNTGIMLLIWDFNKLEYISSAGIRILYLYQRIMNKRKGSMKIIGVNNIIMDTFELTGSLDILTVEQISTDNSPIKLYMFADIVNVEYTCNVLLDMYRERGGKRDIIFEKWNGYNDPPPQDGDVYSYDSISLSAMASSGLIMPLPDEVFNDDIFEWIEDSTLYKKVKYGVPYISCASLLFCKKEKYNGEKCVFDIKAPVAAYLKSMTASYYLFALCSTVRDGKQSGEDRLFSPKAFSVIKKLYDLIGGKKEFDNSRFSTYDGFEKFKKGEKDFYIGYGEDLRYLDSENYSVTALNFADDSTGAPSFPTDVVSVSSKLDGNKLNDCLDIVKIMGSTEYQRRICIVDNIPQYMFPTSKSLYSELCDKYSPYRRLYDIISDDENKAARFGDDFFELFPLMEKTLWDKINNLD